MIFKRKNYACFRKNEKVNNIDFAEIMRKNCPKLRKDLVFWVENHSSCQT